VSDFVKVLRLAVLLSKLAEVDDVCSQHKFQHGADICGLMTTTVFSLPSFRQSQLDTFLIFRAHFKK